MLRVLFLCLLALSAAAQTPISPDDRALYGIICRSSGRSLDIARAATSGGAPAVQWEFTHAPSQQWHLVPIREGGEYYRLEAKHSGQCLTLEANPAASAGGTTPLVQRAYTGALGQQWRLVPAGPVGSFQLESRFDGRVATLAAADKFNGTAVVAARAVGRASQQWRLFQLQLRLAAGPPYFAAPEPLAAASTPTGNELQPVPSADGKSLYLSRTRFAGNTEGVAESGDIWLSQSPDQSPDQGHTWGAATRLDSPPGLNTPHNNAVQAVVGPATSPALLVRGTYEASGFKNEGVSRVPLGSNSRPVPLRIATYYSTNVATGFYMTPDEKILLLSLERDDAQGGNDLYLSRPDGAGGFTAPQSLGAVVNSPGYEFAPWLSADTKMLYFSSYGHQGYGSADIFRSQRLDDSWTKWSPVENLGPRFNGPGFDAYFALGPDGVAYFATSGASPTAPADLRRTPPGPPPADSVAAPIDPEKAARALVTGRVLDARTSQPIAGGAQVQALLLGSTIDFRSTAQADAAGFQLSLVPGRYRFTTTAGLLTRVDTLVIGAGESRRYEPRLTPATVGSRLDLPAIIFTQGQAKLLGSSFLTLNELAKSLSDNSQLEIRLEGHTDNVGPADKNQVLSEQRVAEVKRYLVGRGVAESRITTVGFGGTKPKFGNDREETRKLNRRVELVITK